MKKVLSLLLCATLCLSFSACKKKKADHTTVGGRESVAVSTQMNRPGGQSVSSDESRTTSPTYTHPEYDPDDPTPRPNESDRVLFSSFGLTAYLRTAEIVPSYNGGYPRLTFYITNSSGQNFDVRITVRAINRYAVEYGDSVFLLSKTAAVLPITCNEHIDGQLEEAIVEITVKNESKIELYHSYITVDLRQSEE